MNAPKDIDHSASTVSAVKKAYDDSSPHQRAQIRTFINNLPENTGINDTARLAWLFANCDIRRREAGTTVAPIVRRNQIDFQLKKAKP
jgi:hypothetical protein